MNKVDKAIPERWCRCLLASYGLVGFILLTTVFGIIWKLEAPPGILARFALPLILAIALYRLPISHLLDSATGKSLAGWDKGVRGVILFVVFCAAVFFFWLGTPTWQPALFGVTPLFAALLIWMDIVRADWALKKQFGLEIGPDHSVKCRLEYLKISHGEYLWKLRVGIVGFFGVAVAFCWGAAQHAMEVGPQVYPKVAWGMGFAAYGSIGILLIVNIFLGGILETIKQEILGLESPLNEVDQSQVNEG